MYEVYANTHAKCQNCGAHFPKSWVQTQGAFKTDDGYFCSQNCKSRYAAKAVLQNRILSTYPIGTPRPTHQENGLKDGFLWEVRGGGQ
jgi:hypothetical protein